MRVFESRKRLTAGESRFGRRAWHCRASQPPRRPSSRSRPSPAASTATKPSSRSPLSPPASRVSAFPRKASCTRRTRPLTASARLRRTDSRITEQAPPGRKRGSTSVRPSRRTSGQRLHRRFRQQPSPQDISCKRHLRSPRYHHGRGKAGVYPPSDDPSDPSPLKVRDVRVEDQGRYIVCLVKIGRPGTAMIGKRWCVT